MEWIENIKRKRIRINNTFNRSYLMILKIAGLAKLLEFVYDCGAGEGNSMGFGCLGIGGEGR